MDKLQFLVLIFAVLLSKLCNVSLCIFKQFFDSLDSCDLPYKIVENLKFELYPNQNHKNRDISVTV